MMLCHGESECRPVPTQQPESLRVLINTHGDELFAATVGHNLEGLPRVDVRQVLPSGERWPEGGVNMQRAHQLLDDPNTRIPPGQGTDPEVLEGQKCLAAQITEENKEFDAVADLHNPMETAFTVGYVCVHEQALSNPRVLGLLNALGELATHIVVTRLGMLAHSRDRDGNLNSVILELDPRNPKHQPDKVREVIVSQMAGTAGAIPRAFDPSKFSWYRSMENITRQQAVQHGLAGRDVRPLTDLPIELAHEYGHDSLVALVVPDIATDDPERPFWGEAAAPLDPAEVCRLLS